MFQIWFCIKKHISRRSWIFWRSQKAFQHSVQTTCHPMFKCHSVKLRHFRRFSLLLRKTTSLRNKSLLPNDTFLHFTNWLCCALKQVKLKRLYCFTKVKTYSVIPISCQTWNWICKEVLNEILQNRKWSFHNNLPLKIVFFFLLLKCIFQD